MSARKPNLAAAQLSIGALSRATGVPVETLRTWESRYGYPVPERKPSGHRVYPVGAVPRLRKVAQAIARGHRAGDVVGASEAELEQLLEVITAPAPAPSAQPRSVAALMALVEAQDGAELTRQLLADWALLGPVAFLDQRLAELIERVGEAWSKGQLDIRHEHFLTERLEDVLRSLRLPLEARSQGPRVALATLSGERHGLGLEMAALCFTLAGWRPLSLGVDLPLDEIVEACGGGVRAVAISASSASDPGKVAAALAQLRAELPRRVAVVAGGRGARTAAESAEVFQSFAELDRWARSKL